MALPAIIGLLGPAVIKGVIAKIGQKNQPTQADIEAAVNAAVADALADPAIKNATNSEPLYQSRTFLGSMAAFLTASGALAVQADINGLDLAGYDWELLIPNIAVVLGSAFSIYGRVRSGLSPLFSRK